MAKREKISEERRKLIQEFIKSNDLKTTGDIQEAINDFCSFLAFNPYSLSL